MTDKLDLDELERLEREATPGPWRDSSNEYGCWVECSGCDCDDGDHHVILEVYDRKNEADRALILALRNDAPRLFERVRELEKAEEHRQTWQKCAEHSEINSDNHWACADCMFELRHENATLRARIAELERQITDDEDVFWKVAEHLSRDGRVEMVRLYLASRREGGGK